MKTVAVFLVVFGIGANCEIDNKGRPSEESMRRGLSDKCGEKEPSACIALELVGYVDRMLKTASYRLSEDAMIFDESNGVAAEMKIKPESLGRAGKSLEDQAQQYIVDRLWNFATSRSLRYRLTDNADLLISGVQEKDGSLGVGVSVKEHQAVATGRGRNKDLGPFLAAAALKLGLLGAMTFKGLTLLVGKALMISKIALLLSTIIGLKKLFSHQVTD